VDLGEKRTLGGPGSDAHLTRVHLEGTGNTHGRYDSEKHTWWIRRLTGLNRHGG
jgi:hypothetical protein